MKNIWKALIIGFIVSIMAFFSAVLLPIIYQLLQWNGMVYHYTYDQMQFKLWVITFAWILSSALILYAVINILYPKTEKVIPPHKFYCDWNDKHPIAIDLTSIFGFGKEPSQEECSRLIKLKEKEIKHWFTKDREEVDIHDKTKIK